MANSTEQTLSSFETQNEDAPILVAMVYHSDIESISSGLSSDVGTFLDDGGFSRITMVLALSFIAMVTISRRPTES